ncbi:MAG: selenocysteine-specific translation elongation factor [Lentisphaerales bacterium]|nr:selenocysteine-specific translation elongation factor [Lentisphaerales bacterium]
MKRHWTIGTAGHIDHGKTSLLKALTGKDLDTHKEEKKRGITINNGFFHLKLEDYAVGVIDVPGHSDFIKNMISGACGIDLAMLVIAGNSGPEKQTLEHLRILKILGMQNIIAVITKADLMEEDDKEILTEFLSETFEEAGFSELPIIYVSSHTGEGLEELKAMLVARLAKLQDVETKGTFRLNIDRAFTIKGHGTVTTGTVTSGSATLEDSFHLYPKDEKLKIRSMQRHGSETDSAVQGDRCSFNLPGISVDELRKGDIISNTEMSQSELVDAQLSLFPGNELKRRWFDALLYSGSYESSVRISLLDCDKLAKNESAYIQIYLPENRPFSYGDSFILRSSSGDVTLGGGIILDPCPLHHRRRHKKVIDYLKDIDSNGLKGLINTKIGETSYVVSSGYLSKELNIPENEIIELTAKGLSRTDIFTTPNNSYLISRPRLKELKKQILKEMDRFHAVHYLNVEGISLDELVPKFASFGDALTGDFMKLVLEQLINDGSVVKSGGGWSLSSFNPTEADDLKENIELVKKWYIHNDVNVYSQRNLLEEAEPKGITEKKLDTIISFLVKSNWLTKFEDYFTMTEAIDRIRPRLLSHLHNVEPLTVAGFRDLIEGNRKFCLMAFALYEREGLVVRDGDNRVLTQKGVQFVRELENA